MVRKRISLTLDEETVNQVDKEKNRQGFSNRSRAVESFLNEYLDAKTINTAVILCGGDKKEVSCLKSFDEKPVLLHKVQHLIDYGVKKIILATNKNNKAVNKVLEEFDDVDVKISKEERPLGTAGCLRKFKEDLKETFILTNGDVICKVDIEDMLNQHRENNTVATMALTTITEAKNYGVVRLKGNKAVSFEEKPEEPGSKLINAGFYVLEPEIMDYILKEDKELVAIEDIFKHFSADGKLDGYVYEGEWHDVGNN